MISHRQNLPREPWPSQPLCTCCGPLPEPPVNTEEGMIYNLYAALIEEHRKNCDTCKAAKSYAGICKEMLFLFNDYSALQAALSYRQRGEHCNIERLRRNLADHHDKWRAEHPEDK